ncbi:MAG: outer membrane protein transport protein [Sulfurimonadaceae bacterium]|jgi:long-chain fatty acid transport protein|nr:outer membrane protein transport protein [Sulfurimonadaceae bacterium]
MNIKHLLLISLFSFTSLFATNGSNLIGLGSKARGMGGIGIGYSHGAESGLSNGALITSVDKTEISIGATLFMPDVTFDNGMGGGSYKSKADMNIIPEISLATRVNEHFYFGIGMWGTAGMGVDYRSHTDNFAMVTNLQLMQFGVPLAYKQDMFSLSITPVIQYGSLDINYETPAGNVGSGVSQDLALGYNIGAAIHYDDFTFGLMYKSQIDMEYTSQLSKAMGGFGVIYTNDTLSTPAEIGLGISYKYDKNIFAFDYKQLRFADAKGYKDFLWENQNVFAFGYMFDAEDYALRLGYNYAKSPIKDRGLAYSLENTLNLLGFPAIVESHITVGATYHFSPIVSLDGAYVHALETKQSADVYNPDGATTRKIEAKHSQSSFSVQLNYLF